MRFGDACTRIRTQHMLYKIYVLFQSCRCPNLEQSVEDSVSYKSFLSEDSERSFSGMRKIPVEADFLFFYSTVPGEAMEFSVENMHAFVIIENYSYYSFINTIDLLCPSIWTRFVLRCWFYMHLIGKQSEVTIYEGNAYWFTSIIKCPSVFQVSIHGGITRKDHGLSKPCVSFWRTMVPKWNFCTCSLKSIAWWRMNSSRVRMNILRMRSNRCLVLCPCLPDMCTSGQRNRISGIKVWMEDKIYLNGCDQMDVT